MVHARTVGDCPFPCLDPQLLTTFSAIVGAGSISAAAARLGCGKSVVSRQLARLEADLDALVLVAVEPLMFHESSRPAGPVLWLNHDVIAKQLNQLHA